MPYRKNRVRLTIAKKYFVGPSTGPSLVITAIVRHAAMKTKMAWKTCATTLHFWIYDCGIRMLCGCVYFPNLKVVVCVEGRGKARRVSVNRQLTQPCGYVNTGSLRCYRVCSLRHVTAKQQTTSWIRVRKEVRKQDRERMSYSPRTTMEGRSVDVRHRSSLSLTAWWIPQACQTAQSRPRRAARFFASAGFVPNPATSGY